MSTSDDTMRRAASAPFFTAGQGARRPPLARSSPHVDDQRLQTGGWDEAKNLSDTEGSPCTPSQVEAIFFAALNEKTAAARADYLARACGDNATLRLARGTAPDRPSGSG